MRFSDGHLLHTQDLEEELELDRRRVSEAEGVAKRAEEELAVAKERLLLQEDELQSRAGSHSGLKVISSTSGDVKKIVKQGGGSSSIRKVTLANQKPEEKWKRHTTGNGSTTTMVQHKGESCAKLSFF